VWSKGSQQPMFPSYGHHANENPSSSDHTFRGEKGNVKIPCWLCKEMHHTYLFPRIDEASKLLEDIVFFQKQPPTSSHESPPDPPLVNEVVDPTLPLESEFDTAQVLLATIYSSRQGEISPVSTETSPSIEVISFYWNRLTDPCIPSYPPFQLIV
jgi:hypothetical protein